MPRERLRPDPNRSLVGFVVGQVYYAVPIHAVREIVAPTTITPLPHAPDAVAGIAGHRDQVIPIVDLRKRFGLPAQSDRSAEKWILVTVADRLVALTVDCVVGVFGTHGAQISPPPELGSGDELRGFAGVTNYDDQLCFVLDLSRLALLTDGLSAQLLLKEANA